PTQAIPHQTPHTFPTRRSSDLNLDTNIWIVAADNADRGKTLRQVTTNPGPDWQPAWSPDGQWIADVTVVEPDLIWYATDHLAVRSEEHTSELQSRFDLVCRLLL